LSGLSDLGWDSRWQQEREEIDAPGNPYRVVRHDSVKVLVSDGNSVEHVSFPRSLSLAVGDWVLVENETVRAVVPRRTVLERDHEIRGPQLIAANVDLVLVVFGSDRPLKQSKVTRFVAFAWDIGARPIVIISKADLVDGVDEALEQITGWMPDVEILRTSIDSGEGIQDVFRLLEGKTGTFIGESGVGKSSLVNALMEDEVAWVGEVRETDAKGRHVTSHRELHLLPGGGMIIDNPGIRALGLSAEGEGVEFFFADIEELTSECRFRDCAHDKEPGCAVQAAVTDGTIQADRWLAYLRFINEQGDAQKRSDEKGLAAHFRREAAAVREAREVRDEDQLKTED
jgi:ribosome biogenesis GTPase